MEATLCKLGLLIAIHLGSLLEIDCTRTLHIYSVTDVFLSVKSMSSSLKIFLFLLFLNVQQTFFGFFFVLVSTLKFLVTIKYCTFKLTMDLIVSSKGR